MTRAPTPIECDVCGDTVILDTIDDMDADELACSCRFHPLGSLPDEWRVTEPGESTDAGTNPTPFG